MIFGKKDDPQTCEPETHSNTSAGNSLLLIGFPEAVVLELPSEAADSPEENALDARPIKPSAVTRLDRAPSAEDVRGTSVLVAFHQTPEVLTNICQLLTHERESRGNGTPILIIVCSLTQLSAFGSWLHQQAVAEELQGIRIILNDDPQAALAEVPARLEEITESNIIKMPTSTDIIETEDVDYKYFYCISPELRRVVTFIRGLAENGISRIYLMGGPGAGKTSLAYYFYLCRNQGNFVTVNLTAESTDDKSSMKSLLCGHVVGAFPGSGSREGAISFARDGVVFLDESHGVSGVVMEVLMEVLDSGQYMPYGATNKRKLECSVIFATNRSWDHIRSQVNIDEHARLGATLIGLPDLAKRREDLIAVLAAMIAKFHRQCKTWTPIVGISPDAWELIKACPWRGNTRALMRVIETACVSCASKGHGEILQATHVQEGIELWEPETHDSHAIYTSF